MYNTFFVVFTPVVDIDEPPRRLFRAYGIIYNVRNFEPVHEILIMFASASDECSCKAAQVRKCEDSPEPSLLAHSMDTDDDINQNVDL